MLCNRFLCEAIGWSKKLNQVQKIWDKNEMNELFNEKLIIHANDGKSTTLEVELHICQTS